MKHIFTIFVFILSSLVFSFSQTNYRFENISVNQGLGFNNVQSIVQDKYGYIWLAATYGLYRFDGYNLEDYSCVPGDDKTLHGLVCSHLFIDKEKNLIALGDSLNIYNYKTQEFDALKIVYDGSATFTKNSNDEIVQYVGKKKVFEIYNLKTKESHELNIKFDFVDSSKLSIRRICCDNDNNLWIASDNNIKDQLFKVSLNDYYNKKKLVASLVIENPRISCISLDNRGRVWIAEEHNLKYYDKSTNKFVDFFSIPDAAESSIWSIYLDSKNRLWVGLSGNEGIRCIDVNTLQYRVMKADIPGKYKLYTSCGVRNFFEDSFGVLWMCTFDKGVYKLNLNSKQFEYYNKERGLADDNTESVFEDSKGVKYFGSLSGLTVFYPNGNTRIYKMNEEKLPHIFISNYFKSICELPGNNILTGGCGLTVSNFNKNIFYYLIPNKSDSSLSGWIIYDINKGQKSGHYWIAGQKVFNEISDSNLERAIPGITREMQPRIKLLSTISTGFVSSLYWFIYEDREGIVWLGGGNGLYRYDPKKNQYKHYPYDPDKPEGLHGKDVNSYCEDSKGRLWFTTLGGGLCRFDRETEKFYHVTKQNGLPSNYLYGILEDTHGNLWISSNNGLFKYNPDTKEIRLYDESDGVQGRVFNQRSLYKTPQGKMYFGGTKGVTAFWPDSIHDSSIPPRVVLTRLLVNNKQVRVGEKVNGDIILKQSLMELDKIELSHRNKVFAIEFSGLHTVAPEKIKYLYKMEGFDKEWIATDAKCRRANYSNLSAGTYTFKVRACNRDGVWNKEERSLVLIKVKPPYYKTWWFITLCILIIISLVTFYILFRERKLRMEKKILERKVEERTVQLKEANEELSVTADSLAHQKEELAEKNKDITDSIRYAKRIQKALLPQNIMNERKDVLIYFRPKDIVSGDFYWLANIAGKEFIAAVDCTGHGVPGAFMSIIGINILNKIVKEFKLTKPSEILFMLNSELHNTLKSYSTDDEVKDGMDLSLIAIDTNTNKVEYAGAMNSIYLIRSGQLSEFKADRNSIGQNTDNSIQFTNHEIEIQKDDMLYLFSDGFVDQFGGPNGKKFKASRIKELFVTIASLDMQGQHNKLNAVFEDWLGELEQIDDVLVIGRKF